MVRLHVDTLLEKLEGPVAVSEKRRELQAVQVLEAIDAPEAQEVVTTLAKGAADAWLTQEAVASLKRLAKRPAANP